MLYPSRLKQSGGGTGGTDVYIDGVKSSASRVDITSPIVKPSLTSTSIFVNYNDEIYGFDSNEQVMYKLVNNEFVLVGNLPYPFATTQTRVVVYNNEMHLLGGNNVEGYSQNHYKWNGTSWVSVSTLPYDFYSGRAVIYDNEIHILGGLGTSNYVNHYKWDGTSWVSASTLPMPVQSYTDAVVYNNEIHIFDGYGTPYRKKHYKWDGNTWSEDVELLESPSAGSVSIVYDGKIHCFYLKTHVEFDGTEWIKVNELELPCNYSAVEYNQTILYNTQSGYLVDINRIFKFVSIE